MLNRVTLVGRITRDPELKFTQTQKAVTSFSLAVNRSFTNQAGEREADFINIVVWGRSAENLVKYVGKGSLIAVDGRIQTRSYETPQGERRYVTEVVGETVHFLESRNSVNREQQAQPFSEAVSNNMSSNSSNKDPFADFGNSIDISDDDLPF